MEGETDSALLSLMSMPCPCGDDDINNSHIVKDEHDNILLRHCMVCDRYMGIDDSHGMIEQNIDILTFFGEANDLNMTEQEEGDAGVPMSYDDLPTYEMATASDNGLPTYESLQGEQSMPHDYEDGDSALAASLSIPCSCGNDDPYKLHLVTDEADEQILARHCEKCDGYTGVDDTTSPEQIEAIKLFQQCYENGLLCTEPCPKCGNTDINKYTFCELENGERLGLTCECGEMKHYVVDYENAKSTETRVESINDLHPGDVIAWKNPFKFTEMWYYSIVESVDKKNSSVTYIGYGVPMLFRKMAITRNTYWLNASKKLYRIDYDECHEARIVVARAQAMLEKQGYNIATNRSVHFTEWCKLGKHDMTLSEHEMDLARLYNSQISNNSPPKKKAIQSIDMVQNLKEGDHIAWLRFLGYWHHAIVINVTQTELTVVEFSPTQNKSVKGEVGYTTFNLAEADDKLGLNNESLFLMEYSDSLPADIVVARARMCLGQKGYIVFLNNCEHITTWCKVGQSSSKQVKDLNKSNRESGVSSACGYASRSPFIRSAAGFGFADWVGMGVGLTIIIAFKAIKLKDSIKDLRETKNNGQPLGHDIARVSGDTGDLIGSILGFVVGEMFLPIGGGLIGGFFGSLAGKGLGWLIGRTIDWMMPKTRTNGAQ